MSDVSFFASMLGLLLVVALSSWFLVEEILSDTPPPEENKITVETFRGKSFLEQFEASNLRQEIKEKKDHLKGLL